MHVRSSLKNDLHQPNLVFGPDLDVTLPISVRLHWPTDGLHSRLLAHQLASEALQKLAVCDIQIGSKNKIRLDAARSKIGGPLMIVGCKSFFKEDLTCMINTRNSYNGCKKQDLLFYPTCDEQGNLQLPGPEIFENDSKLFGKEYASVLADINAVEAEIAASKSRDKDVVE
ncbi:3-isopropylmalate dehydratase large subunit [Striga asiatica]|uniref:3-isopropylmalate dehydratase large subunit n=1 Tax=Striga asiatica TaxID=4170 RepID=A0A5A7QZB3_STRAF|nr:3-isopropylmalate dehydratase large subunit [Striga asiatica]